MSVERQLIMASGNKATAFYPIANSLRFRSSASAYLNRTPGSASNRTTWTWSGWVKRGWLTDFAMVFSAGTVASDIGELTLYFLNDDTFGVSGGTTLFKQTAQVFRDPSAWYHFVVAWDTTQATASNRIKIYVNGVQVTSFATSSDPALNLNGAVNDATLHAHGKQTRGVPYYFDGYMAEINFIDGQALTPSSFGETSSTTGVWIPKKYTGSYGTNGFYLNFSNGTSTTTLGNDSSGNSNNWTTNNISLTTGSTYDWMIDSPTSYAGSSYGVGNYCVLNPLKIGSNLALSSANLRLAASSSASHKCFGTIGVSSGKWYWEILVNSSTEQYIGIAKDSSPINNYVGEDANSWGYRNTGPKVNNSNFVSYGATYTTNDVIAIALDMDAGSLTFYKNGVSQGVAYTGLSGTLFPALDPYVSGNSFDANFGQRPFAYTPPSGYKSLCTQNLSTPSIVNGSKYMAATLYTGNGSTQSVVNSGGFQPDFVWVKSRSLVAGHELVDSVRGVAKTLYSNLTNAEDTTSQTVTAFNSNGFSVGNDSGANSSGATQVGWQWKASGTAVTNTAGSISSQVSANTTAGFSVVTFTSQASGSGTFGHGLGVAPSMVITKIRTSATDWPVYHASLTSAAYYLYLNTTAAQSNSLNIWNSTAPTSSVVTLGAAYAGSYSIVAYCFAAIAGYSAFGSYTGNGSANGPFVYCGFRPKWVMIKRSDGVANWRILDTSRDTYNIASQELYPNLSNAEGTFASLDDLSNGFKIRNTDPAYNVSSGTYIYAAFCEVPFNFSLAR